MSNTSCKLITTLIWVFFAVGVSGYLASPVLLYTTGDSSVLPVVLGISLVTSVLALLLIKQKQAVENS